MSNSIHPINAVPFVNEAPRPLIGETPRPAAYPVHALGVLHGAVEAVRMQAQAPVEIPAASALTTASLAVQAFADVETLGGIRPLSLNALTIADSGERKSSCYKPFMKAILSHQKAGFEDYKRKKAAYDTDAELWKRKRNSIIANATAKKNPISDDERKDALKELGSAPTPPRSPQIIIKDPTLEGLIRVYMEGQSSLGIFSDEAGQFLGGHSMNGDNKQKTLAGLNDLWQGQPINRTRAGDGQITIDDVRLAVNLMLQPSVARKFMSDAMVTEIGFLPRFLICEPETAIGTRYHANSRYDQPSIDAFNKQVQFILDTPMPVDEDTGRLAPRVLKLSPQARALLIEYHDKIERLQGKGQPLKGVTGYASKSAEQVTRIAGVLTLFNNIEATEVTIEIMGNAIELAEYYLLESLRISEIANPSPETVQAEKLRVWLIDKWKAEHITRRDILQRAPSSLRNKKVAIQALLELQKEGWIVPIEGGMEIEGVSCKEVWRIVRPANTGAGVMQ